MGLSWTSQIIIIRPTLCTQSAQRQTMACRGDYFTVSAFQGIFSSRSSPALSNLAKYRSMFKPKQLSIVSMIDEHSHFKYGFLANEIAFLSVYLQLKSDFSRFGREIQRNISSIGDIPLTFRD